MYRLIVVSVFASIAFGTAWAQPSGGGSNVRLGRVAPVSKPREATVRKLIDLRTGMEVPQPTSRVRVPDTIFDNELTGRSAPPYYNFSYADASLSAVCDADDPNEFAYIFIDPILSESDCDPNGDDWECVGPWTQACACWDQRWDNYIIDAHRWGCDPNTTFSLETVAFWIGMANPLPVDRRTNLGVVFGFFERFDRDGDGRLGNSAGGPWLTVITFEPGAPAGVYRVELYWAFEFPDDIRPWGYDMFMLDVLDQEWDPNADAATGPPVCGVYLPLPGGVMDDVDCPTPDELVVQGSVLDPYLHTDFAIWTTGYADANCAPIDPNLNGVPDLQYEEIWAGGLRDRIEYVDSQGRKLAAGFMFSLGATEPNNWSCSADIAGPDGCGSHDQVVDLTDLGCLLANWGSPSAACWGDIGGAVGCGVSDGNTDLTDLGCLLGAWGACP